MLLILVSALLLCSLTESVKNRDTAGKKNDISGHWVLVEHFSDEKHVHRMKLEVTGNKITGQIGASKLDGTIEGSTLTFKWLSQDGKQVEAIYTGRIENGGLVGDGNLAGDGGWQNIKLQWNAYRPVTRTSEEPQTHTFTPMEFHRVFSATVPPVLRIFPGDTVKTKSIDAGGTDENSVQRSLGGNPLTGPFYVEGALPGDTLVIRLNRVRLNRDWARSGQTIVANVFTPGYLMNMNRAKGFNSRWKLDIEKGVASLDKPTEALKNLTVPLRPMLGCVGVAPPGQNTITTRDSGFFGGNMDYNEIGEGATIYLPVFHEGALLYMGDGHAAQGDGELTGDALETSMEFEFTVDVLSEKSIGMPRAENEEYIMAIGIGGSLDLAAQRATTEMAHWLEGEYKLNSNESAMILGFALKYDLADLIGTQLSIVAKIPKSAIAQLNRK